MKIYTKYLILLLVIILFLFIYLKYYIKNYNYIKENINEKYKNNINLRIVLCAFFKQTYIEQAKLSIKSIRKNGNFNGQIDLITNIDCNIDGVNVIKVNDCKDINDAFAYRLKMLDILDWKENDTFLYLDTDIIVMKRLSNLKYNNEKVNVYTHKTAPKNQDNNWYAGLLTKDPKILKQKPFCSGIMLFKPSNNIKEIFKEIWNFFQNDKKYNIKNLKYGDQPYINYKLCQHNLYDISLNNVVFDERTKYNNLKLNINNSHIFNHFCGYKGNDVIHLMKKYINNNY